MQFTLAQVAEITGGRVLGDSTRVVSTYYTDSREVIEGGLFFALRGKELDGHSFVPEAVRRGAGGVVVSQPDSAWSDISQVVVADGWSALYKLAAEVRQRVDPLVVGITGSNGKTSTKELTAAALSPLHKVHRNPGNRNTETGLPMAILQLEPEHTAMVLEMGMQGRGEIAQLAELAKPSIGVITLIGSVHAEFFPDGRTGIAHAKAELIQALPPEGLAVLNADDDYFELLASLAASPIKTFGSRRGDLRADSYKPLPEGGSVFSVNGIEVRLRLPGRHQVNNALAALIVAESAGISLTAAAAAMAEVEVGHRLQEIPQPDGWVLVDDAYNASPESMLAAFAAMAERKPEGRRLALLGEMRELGKLSEDAHRRMGEEAKRVFDKVAVIEVGWGKVLAAAAGGELLPDLEAAATWLRSEPQAGDRVLTKASLGVGLHKVVEKFK